MNPKLDYEEILKEHRWNAKHYGGHEPEGWCILSQHRDSSCLERSNYAVAFETLGAERFDRGDVAPETAPPVYDFRAGHWAVGWIEHLIVRYDAPEEKKIAAAEIVRSLADYPVLDEMKWSEMEWNEIYDYWAREPLASRIDYCRDAGVSIFAARRQDDIPEQVYDRLCDGWQ